MDTKAGSEGLSGIQYWNMVYPALKDRKAAELRLLEQHSDSDQE